MSCEAFSSQLMGALSTKLAVNCMLKADRLKMFQFSKTYDLHPRIHSTNCTRMHADKHRFVNPR